MGEYKKECRLVCMQCGKTFLGKKNQKYCSDDCRYETYHKAYKEKTYSKICPYCGSEFVTHNKKAIYCSGSCASRKHAENVRMEYFCEYCGKPRHSDHPKRHRFCSRSCASKAKAYGSIAHELEIKAQRNVPKILIKRNCKECGKEFIPLNNHHIYCSHNCMYEATLRAGRDQWAAEYIPRTVVCDECGKKFVTSCGNTRNVYCSDRCLSIATKRRYKEKRKRQMIMAYKEPVGIKSIYKRDRGYCQICGLPVPDTTDPTNMWAATRDHIIPLSRGGEHSMRNCQLTHRLCNSIKVDTVEDFSIDWKKKCEEEPGRWDAQLNNLFEQINTSPDICNGNFWGRDWGKSLKNKSSKTGLASFA